MTVQQILTAYYTATPLFLLFDWATGANVRAAGFQAYPALKYGYYAVCMAAAFGARLAPRRTAAITIVESAANILSLVVGVLAPIYGLPAALDRGGPLPPLMTPARLVNFLLAGAAAVLAIRLAERELGQPDA
jgi:hypothetical protein